MPVPPNAGGANILGLLELIKSQGANTAPLAMSLAQQGAEPPIPTPKPGASPFAPQTSPIPTPRPAGGAGAGGAGGAGNLASILGALGPVSSSAPVLPAPGQPRQSAMNPAFTQQLMRALSGSVGGGQLPSLGALLAGGR